MRIFFLNIFFIIIFSVITNAQNHNFYYYINQAKLNSPLINTIKNNNKIVKLNTQEIKKILSAPKIKANANILFAPIINHDNNINKLQIISKDANTYTGYDLAYSDGGQYQGTISIEQQLFTKNRYNNYLKQADIQTQTNVNKISLTTHELERLVEQQYILCLKAKKQAEITKTLIDTIDKQLQIMDKLVKNAIYKKIDLMIMQIENDNYKIKYSNYIAQYKQNIADLNLICGINDTGYVNIDNINFKIKPDTVNNSLFIKKYKLDSLNISTKQILFNQKYKPQIKLFANAGINAIYIPSFNRFGFATGINIFWNIFDGNQKKIQQEKTIIELQNIEFKKQYFINQYNTNKQKYISQIKAVDKQIAIVKKQLKGYNKLLKLYTDELLKAQVSIMDFKNLIRDISEKKQENLNLQIKKQILISTYNYWIF